MVCLFAGAVEGKECAFRMEECNSELLKRSEECWDVTNEGMSYSFR